MRQQAAIKSEYFGEEQMSMKKTAKRIIDEDINPYMLTNGKRRVSTPPTRCLRNLEALACLA